MKITIDLLAGPYKTPPTVEDIDKNINAIVNALDEIFSPTDFVALNDTLAILTKIREQLDEHYSTARKRISTKPARAKLK